MNLCGAFDHCILRPIRRPSQVSIPGSEAAIELHFTLVAMTECIWRHIKHIDLTSLLDVVLDFEI